MIKDKQEVDNFHVEYLIREHADILQELSEKINNKRNRIEKLKGEIVQLNIVAEVAKKYIDLLKFTGWGKSAHMTITFG